MNGAELPLSLNVFMAWTGTPCVLYSFSVYMEAIGNVLSASSQGTVRRIVLRAVWSLFLSPHSTPQRLLTALPCMPYQQGLLITHHVSVYRPRCSKDPFWATETPSYYVTTLLKTEYLATFVWQWQKQSDSEGHSLACHRGGPGLIPG